ncbi:MAG TPA: T9SS type A sorting domain-containing protein [candidate division Zixibacteria bacterium]|nr:T9SS type A sorting domain-containing protein [candidate division Zixibacteria bacterium]
MKLTIKVLLLLVLAGIAFGQAKHIGIWAQWADTSTSWRGEYWRVCDALDGGPYDWVKHDYWDYTAINAESLSLIDIFIVPEQERLYEAGRDSLAGDFLAPILRSWVEAGGLLIAFYSHGAKFVNGAGFTRIGGSSMSTMSRAIEIVTPEHPIAEGVAGSFNGMNASYAYPEFEGWTLVGKYSSGTTDYMSIGYEEIGAGCVLFFGWDYYDTPTPNEDLLLQNAVVHWGLRSEGPILRAFMPDEGTIVTGYPTIRMEFQDDDGINLASFQFYLNDVLFTGHDPIVSAVGDTVFIALPDTLPDGEVTLRIRRIEDTHGHEGPDTVRVYNFFIDNTPPELIYYEPSGVLTHIPDGAMIEYRDALSGTSDENWYFYFEGADTIRKGRTGVITEGDSVVLIAFSLVGVNPSPNDTNWMEFGVWDTPDAGEPNIERHRWWFVPAVGIGERLPETMEFAVSPNPFNAACRITAPAGASVEIFDIAGRRVFAGPSETTSTTHGREIIWKPDESILTGIYLVRSTTPCGVEETKRVVLLK